MDARWCSFQNYVSHRWRGAHLQNISENLKKNDVEKHQKSDILNLIREMPKLNAKSWMQKGPKSKKSPRPSREQHFYWRKRAQRRGIARANAPKSGSKLLFLKALCLESFFKNVLLTAARSSFLKKCDAKSELEHNNYERGILKLAFLMQSRIMLHRTQLFCSSLGIGYCFLKIS